MYLPLLITHNTLRWIALLFLLYSIWLSFNGYSQKLAFSKSDNAFRHWTATLFQVQMVIGFILYDASPFVDAYWRTKNYGSDGSGFFAIVHSVLMFAAVVAISMGSALAKRKPSDEAKYKTMLLWFCIGFLILLVAIPWPFSPLAQRPLFRIS